MRRATGQPRAEEPASCNAFTNPPSMQVVATYSRLRE